MRDKRCGVRREELILPSSLILHPSSFIPHPSSLILHPSSFILHLPQDAGLVRTVIYRRQNNSPTIAPAIIPVPNATAIDSAGRRRTVSCICSRPSFTACST